LIRGIFRPVDEAEQVALVVVLEAVHFVDGGGRVADAAHDLRGELEAEIGAHCADVEKEITRRRDRMMGALDLAERMQRCGTRLAEQPIPRVRAESHDAAQ
jgi:hypothetical protein